MSKAVKILLIAFLASLPLGSPNVIDTPLLARSETAYTYDWIPNIPYYDGPDAHSEKHLLDIYRPHGVENAPVYFFVHGGTWQFGNKEIHGFVGQRFARQGYVSVVINYRLTPEVIHPGHIEDVAKAFSWVYENIDQNGGNPDRIFISGHSAGGHLVALLALNEKYLEAEGLSTNLINAVLPISGVYDIASYPDGILAEAFTSDPEIRLDASPIAHVDEEQPPFLITYAEFDLITLNDQAEDLAAKLLEHGSDVEIHEIPLRTHTTILFRIGSENDQTSNMIIDYMDGNLD